MSSVAATQEAADNIAYRHEYRGDLSSRHIRRWAQETLLQEEPALLTTEAGNTALQDFLLVLSEAASNAIRHGFPEDAKQPVIHIHHEKGTGILCGRVVDSGPGFDPEAAYDREATVARLLEELNNLPTEAEREEQKMCVLTSPVAEATHGSTGVLVMRQATQRCVWRSGPTGTSVAFQVQIPL